MAASLGVLRGPNEGWCGQVGWAPLMCQGNRNEISGYALVFFFFPCLCHCSDSQQQDGRGLQGESGGHVLTFLAPPGWPQIFTRASRLPSLTVTAFLDFESEWEKL